MVNPPVLNARLGLLVAGTPDEKLLGAHATGPGDLWHSGLLRGFENVLGELMYWEPDWWYLNNVPADAVSVSWRCDPEAFAIRPEVWERLGGFDPAYESDVTRMLDFIFRLIRKGGVPLHVPGLYPAQQSRRVEISRADLYLFFTRNFKAEYRRYLHVRESIRTGSPLAEWKHLRAAEARSAAVPGPVDQTIPIRPLPELAGQPPKVSVILPTLRRQTYARQVVEDLSRQTVPPHEIFLVDQTPPEERDQRAYEGLETNPALRILYPEISGACRARNEAIRRSTGDYLVFADDDIRLLPDFIESYARFFQAYGCAAANGHDLRAKHHTDGLDRLEERLAQANRGVIRAGLDVKFNTANSCVRRDWAEICVGNDLNFEGGYGEDRDFGFRIRKAGGVVMSNPFAANLHLKPPGGGFRWWGAVMRARKRAPWEINRQVGWIRPKPVPTTVYGMIKSMTAGQFREWILQYLLRSWWPQYRRGHETTRRRLLMLAPRILATPLLLVRLWVSYGFARDLLRLGPRYE